MKIFKTLAAVLAMAVAAPSFAGVCCNYGYPNGPSINGIAGRIAPQLDQTGVDHGFRPRQADEGDVYPLPSGEHGDRAAIQSLRHATK